MAQRFTYFQKDGTATVRTEPNGPSPLSGEVWVRGAFNPPDYPSPLDARVGESGIKVWMVIQWFQASDNNQDRLLDRYGNVLRLEDIDSALWYYEQNRESIDQRIQEEMQPV